ncbi:hypothetical protein BIFGAL_02830 [Bifidobacterium gallicum DSM 20093 = LMG 11596]|uniref:Uncharacterized protein n=1 Tax=Bifidobacterium gallicum DSM 20093 = LMG 11596 TaxID=561180 RepID=D1NSS0_9BIFI|nr:hypothetical protein BIFGAL_02830 [Bifidobacterium gallicum DSM 20093 = LMG 11596]
MQYWKEIKRPSGHTDHTAGVGAHSTVHDAGLDDDSVHFCAVLSMKCSLR